MASKFKPRWYQSASVVAMVSYLHESDGHGLVVLPTAAGKSYTQCMFVKEQVETLGDVRICLLSHQKELIAQTYKSLINAWPQAPATIYSAGLGVKKGRGQVVIAGIQSIYNKTNSVGAFDILLIDEAQLVPKKAGGQYARFVTEQMALSPHLRVFGLSATPYRLDSGRLDEGEPRLFTEIIFEVSVGDLIEQGFLCPPITKIMKAQIDVSKVKKDGADYNQRQMAEEAAKLTQDAVAEIIVRAADRKKWVIFGASIDHCYAIQDELALYQVRACVVHGDLDPVERNRLLLDHRAGKYRAIINYGLLTTGYDDVEIDMIAMLRGTASMGLYYQIVGRGFRVIYPDRFDPNECTDEERRQAIADGPKPNFLFLDFGGNIRRHGPIDDLMEKASKKDKKKKTKSSAPLKLCVECDTAVSVSTRTCPDCGHEWEFDESAKHNAAPDEDAAILKKDMPQAMESKTKWVPVRSVSFQEWKKPDKPATLRISYETESKAKTVSEWLTFGGPNPRWARLWDKLTGGAPLPSSARAALDILAEDSVDVHTVAIEKQDRYWQVKGHRTGPDRITARYYVCSECDQTICAQGDKCPCTRGMALPKVARPAYEEEWEDIPF